eukprot:Partr_v1_DN26007_c0_g1_i1_m702 putative aldose 1-epimerase
MPVEIVEKNSNGSPKKYRFHLSGNAKTSVEVYAYGATMTSWKVDGVEKLFVSKDAILDGSKAIRGGIPLVFPQFGKGPASPEIQHGFARMAIWDFVAVDKDEPGALHFHFKMDSSNVVVKQFPSFPHAFVLEFEVKLTAAGLYTGFHVVNKAAVKFEFTSLMHTYFAVGDISQVKVVGLEGRKLFDKVANAERTESRKEVVISSETDCIYRHGGEKPLSIHEGGKHLLTIESVNFRDAVVWNPWVEKAKAMSDFGSDQYSKMICVELGTVDVPPVSLEAGKEWRAGQNITVVGKL